MSTFPDLLKHLGGAPVGIEALMPAEVRMVCRSGNYEPHKFWEGKWHSSTYHTTILSAHDACTSGRNDTVFLSPDSHSQATGLTWSKNMTHLIGMYPPTMFNQRSRIGHSDDFATLFTVSGYGNLFQNLFFMHGRGSGTNMNAITVSGNRNTFINCCIAGPYNATEAGTAGYDTVRITSSENYFNHCVFGADTINDNSTITLVEIGANACRNVFEDCIFHVRATNAGVAFIGVRGPGGNNRHTWFKNCKFVNWGGTSMTVGISWDADVGSEDCNIYLDANCCFTGCTAIVAASYVGDIIIGQVPATTTAAELCDSTTVT